MENWSATVKEYFSVIAVVVFKLSDVLFCDLSHPHSLALLSFAFISNCREFSIVHGFLEFWLGKRKKLASSNIWSVARNYRVVVSALKRIRTTIRLSELNVSFSFFPVKHAARWNYRKIVLYIELCNVHGNGLLVNKCSKRNVRGKGLLVNKCSKRNVHGNGLLVNKCWKRNVHGNGLLVNKCWKRNVHGKGLLVNKCWKHVELKAFITLFYWIWHATYLYWNSFLRNIQLTSAFIGVE